MSDPNSSNSQTPPAPPAPQAGPTLEALQARNVELEKAREGLIKDVQEERRKRQELESRMTPPAPASSPANNDVTQDELGKVLKPYIDPVRQEAQAAKAMLARYEEDKALDLMAARLNKPKSEILTDKALQERFSATRNRYGITGTSMVDLTTKTLDLMDLEDLRQKDTERVRLAKANEGGSLPPGTPPAPNLAKRELTQEDWEKMPLQEYSKLADAGDFVQDPQTGKIVYTPR